MTYPSDCDPQVIELLQEIEAMPEGLERVRRCEHAVSVATRLGGFDNEYWWLRRALDTAGERLDEEDRRSVLWRLKWALTQVVGTPEIPLETARATIDDVEGAFRAHGAALRPIHQHRAALADEIGERAEAGAHLDRWTSRSVTPANAVSRRGWSPMAIRSERSPSSSRSSTDRSPGGRSPSPASRMPPNGTPASASGRRRPRHTNGGGG